MNITAVIPVREGSRRIKNKNIKPFAGSSLLEIKINQLKMIKDITNIVVSSDSEIMLNIAKQNGVIAKKRPVEYCDEKTKSFNETVEYIAENEVEDEIMIWVPCVCPLVGATRIQEGISLYKKIVEERLSYDSVVSTTLIKDYIFNENGPANFSIEHHVPSQMLPKWHIIKNGFFIARTNDMIKWKFVYGLKPYLMELEKREVIDIDDEFDFYLAEYIYEEGMN